MKKSKLKVVLETGQPLLEVTRGSLGSVLPCLDSTLLEVVVFRLPPRDRARFELRSWRLRRNSHVFDQDV